MTQKVATRASASFCAVVDHVVTAKRQLTAWEAGCLYAALCELAAGREIEAQQKITLALLPDIQKRPPVTIIPLPTAEELLQALERLNATQAASTACMRDRGWVRK